ncbi:MAG: phosphoribosylanthranilate isomerase, partial [Acidobacteria bacterium]|nr:phosphoribosylanthranilate isomerase [Acidobacteriota bacterium]
GFNFYPRSPRSIAPRAARSLIERLPPLLTVGVYADETDAELVLGVAQEAGVHILQLHGPRFPELDALLPTYPVIQAVAVGEDFKPELLASLRTKNFLLDAFHPDLKGGTGKTFDWSLARHATKYGTIILAGGLNPENVGRAIAEIRPFAVDVASGVESSPGIKSPALLRAFFAAVEQANQYFSGS